MVEAYVPALEERVAFVEGRVTEQAQMMEGFQRSVARLEMRIDRVDARVNHLETRMDQRFDAVDRRFEGLESRMAAFEHRVDTRFAGIDQRFMSLESTISRQFYWIVGIQMTVGTAVIAAILGVALRH
jgi:uncharacterized coiled-coil protein SlyX